MDGNLINRVANSGLITINLEDYYPKNELLVFDLKDYLYMELILKEKEFRSALKEHDWTVYEGKILIVTCTTDAIIPVWAFMLVAAYAQPYSLETFNGTKEDFLKVYYDKKLASLTFKQYDGQRVVIKGCSNKPVPPSAYMRLTSLLQPYAQSIMYGEPCSTVPIFKRPRTISKPEVL